MTNEDKADLRRIMRHSSDKWTDREAADACGCTVATARRYRRALAPKAA